MKKGIFTLCGALLFAGTLSAQITLDAGNMNISGVLGSSSTTVLAANPNATPSLSAQTNATWDFTSLYYGTAFTAKTYFTSPVPNYTYADSSVESFRNLSYVGINANLAVLQGISTWKQEIDTQAILSTKPSGQQDTVEFSTQVTTLSYPHYILSLPATYHSGWRSNYNYTTSFNVTDVLLGVKHQAGVRYAAVTEADTVIGWGQARVNMTDSTTTTPHQLLKSGYMDVLLVKKTRSVIDTYSLTANKTLYDSLGFTSYYHHDTTRHINTDMSIDTTMNINNGVTPPDTTYTYDTTYTQDTTYTYDSLKIYKLRDTTNTYQYLVYRTGTITPLVTVNYTSASFSTVQSVSVNVDNLSQFNEGVATVPEQYNINIYPNPVINNKVFVDIPDAGTGAWSYELINTLGQTMDVNNINATGGNIHQQLSLPSNLATGIYYMRINNNGSPVFVKALEINK